MEPLCISSLVVQTRPDMLETVRTRLRTLPGAEVVGTSERGKLVLVLDAPGQRAAEDTIAAIQNEEGVLSASLVYQYEDRHESLLEDTA